MGQRKDRYTGCSPDVVQNLLALVVILLQPGPELGRGHHQQRLEGFSQRLLKQDSSADWLFCQSGGFPQIGRIQGLPRKKWFGLSVRYSWQ